MPKSAGAAAGEPPVLGTVSDERQLAPSPLGQVAAAPAMPVESRKQISGEYKTDLNKQYQDLYAKQPAMSPNEFLAEKGIIDEKAAELGRHPEHVIANLPERGVLGKIGHVFTAPFEQMKYIDRERGALGEISEGTRGVAQEAAAKAALMKPTLPGKTPDEQALASGVNQKMTGNAGQPMINPDTSKPYTRDEATQVTYRENLQAKQDVKPEKKFSPKILPGGIGYQNEKGEILSAGDTAIPAGAASTMEKMRVGARDKGVPPLILGKIGPSPDPAAYPQGANDLKYLQDHAAWAQKGIDTQEAITNSTAWARGESFGASRRMAVIDPESGELRIMRAADAEKLGAAPVAGGMQAQLKESIFTDMASASAHLRGAITALPDNAFTTEEIARLSMAMRGGDTQVLNNEIASLSKSHSSTAERDILTWLPQIQERAMALRGVTGMGQGSDMLREQILKTLPSFASGDKDMMGRQLDAFDNQISLLRLGVPIVKGRTEKIREAGKPQQKAETDELEKFKRKP
jgi:hypothetical protein